MSEVCDRHDHENGDIMGVEAGWNLVHTHVGTALGLRGVEFVIELERQDGMRMSFRTGEDQVYQLLDGAVRTASILREVVNEKGSDRVLQALLEVYAGAAEQLSDDEEFISGTMFEMTEGEAKDLLSEVLDETQRRVDEYSVMDRDEQLREAAERVARDVPEDQIPPHTKAIINAILADENADV